MATEEQKKARMMRLCNDIVFGFGKGLYDLFGDSALATVETIGEDILEDMEHELGLEIHGEDPQAILTEIERLIIDEYGLVQSAELKVEDREINLTCHRCQFWPATKNLSEAGVPPYTCVPMMMATAALRKRLDKKARFLGIEQTDDTRTCRISIELL